MWEKPSELSKNLTGLSDISYGFEISYQTIGLGRDLTDHGAVIAERSLNGW